MSAKETPIWKEKPGGKWVYVCPDCGTDDLPGHKFCYWCPECQERKDPIDVERYVPPRTDRSANTDVPDGDP